MQAQPQNTLDADPWTADGMNNPETATVLWRERERRQRSIRTLMMFLVMLLLMDGEEGAQRRQKRLHSRKEQARLEPNVFAARQRQDGRIRTMVQQHERYQALLKKNQGQAVDEIVMAWAEEHADQQKDQFAESAAQIMASSHQHQQQQRQQEDEKDPEDDRKVFHYPWNATGFYRGEWSQEKKKEETEDSKLKPAEHASEQTSKDAEEFSVFSAAALEEPMLSLLQDREEEFGVFILPNGMKIEMRNDNNLTSLNWEELRTDKNNAIVHTEAKSDAGEAKPSITLTHDSGRAAFQFFARSIPSMHELSLVDGFIKIYDSTSPGYSTRKDILLRVRGVLVHAIGKLSLVSNVDVSRSALVIGGEESKEQTVTRRHRRLKEALSNLEEADLELVREDAISLFAASTALGVRRELASSPEFAHRWLTEDVEGTQRQQEELKAEERLTVTEETVSTAATTESNNSSALHSTKANEVSSSWSDAVLPYPFAMDDEKETVRRTKTPAARVMPPREQALEENAAGCGFEINLDIGEVEWTIGEWRKLASRKVNERRRLDPSLKEEESENEENAAHLRGSRAKPIQDLALVMTLEGKIHSSNCGFTASVNATALRTDWDATTSKAINYSFVMMLVCLTQILVLLRQLLHSQGNSAAARVSLLCIGWQTLIDALLCLAHIYMSLSIQPLFSAFASVSFFKLLIFCVIEMKYMAIIIQARNSSAGGQTTEVLRRQIAMLHLRFYTIMAGSFLLFLYSGDKYRMLYVLTLYSFWVPQIVLNIVTEAKTPMHNYYIGGMSLTRLIAPLYMLSIKNNFLKEVYPEAPYDPFTCQMLVLWIGVQTAVLIGQSKYGARFMIPARFLPPKFDYSRPIPASMLPPGVAELPTAESMEDRGDEALIQRSERGQSTALSSKVALPRSGRHTTAVTTRNRRAANNLAARNGESGGTTTMIMTTDAATQPPTSVAPLAPTLDCSICYDAIDIRKSHDYMLAPCNHLFHRECLVQWMDVKMECPICRTELPAL